MDEVGHNDIQNLHQCHICLHSELEKFEEDSPEFKHGSKISKLTRKVVELSSRIADSRIQGGAKVSDPISKDTYVWLLWANGLLLAGILVFMTMLFYSVRTIESKVFPSGRLWTVEEAK